MDTVYCQYITEIHVFRNVPIFSRYAVRILTKFMYLFHLFQNNILFRLFISFWCMVASNLHCKVTCPLAKQMVSAKPLTQIGDTSAYNPADQWFSLKRNVLPNRFITRPAAFGQIHNKTVDSSYIVIFKRRLRFNHLQNHFHNDTLNNCKILHTCHH